MKKSYFLFLLVTITTFAQVQVTYRIAPNKELDLKEGAPAHVREYAEKSRESAEQLIFQLDIENSRSHFYAINGEAGINVDGHGDFKRIAMVQYVKGSEFWTDVSNEKQVVNVNDKAVLSKLVKPDWIVSTETKKIDNYLCYKADYIFEFKSWQGKQMTKKITAWFAPELPYSFGPGKYFGLPGLILELFDGAATTFQATAIKRDAKIPEIKFPQNTIDQTENDKQVKATREFINSRK